MSRRPSRHRSSSALRALVAVCVALSVSSCGGGGSKTSQQQVVPPAAPTGLAATATSPTTVRLTWTDASSDETAFVIERGPAASGPWSELAVVPANTTAFDDTTASRASRIWYRVRARSAGGDSADSGGASAETRGVFLVAGAPTGAGNVDGAGTAARFNQPTRVAVDAAGSAYVADTFNYVVRKVTPAGEVSTYAGDAYGMNSFTSVYGIAVDRTGTIFVAEWNRIRLVGTDGAITTLAGGSYGTADGVGATAQFASIAGIALDGGGNVYAADWSSCTIRKITPAGEVTTIAGRAGEFGAADGTGSAARFNYPEGVAVDASGNVFVADSGNCTVRKITPAGEVSTIAGAAGAYGTTDGTGSSARFRRPTSIAIDASGNLLVTDEYGPTIRKVTPGGVVTTVAGTPGTAGASDGIGSAALFSEPSGIALDASGSAWIVDSGNDMLRRFAPDGTVTTVAGQPSASGFVDGAGGAARFDYPAGAAIDAAGNIFVADVRNSAVRRISPAGAVTTVAGGTNGTSDGNGTAAQFRGPWDVAVDRAGNVYVSDEWSYTVRKISPAGDVTTFAGTAGQAGSTDGVGTAARFREVIGLAIDADGVLYVCDYGNFTVRKITPDGTVTTLAGSPGRSGMVDGVGDAARFRNPKALTVDATGNVYVADGTAVRKITPAGAVSTLAGTNTGGALDATGAAARFGFASGVAVDGSGNLYVADRRNHAIRKITPAGEVTTVVGTMGHGEITPGALPASLFEPEGVAIDRTTGDLLVTVPDAVLRVVP